MGSFYHACDTVLEKLDRVQNHFVKEVGLTCDDASLLQNLVPLSVRRDIGMLGLIFQCSHGTAHHSLQDLFPKAPSATHSYKTRFQVYCHTMQPIETREGTHHALLRRSVFGLLRIWNRLPSRVVHAPSVKEFQNMLTDIARSACRRGYPQWMCVLSPRPVILPETLFFEALYEASLND